MSGDLLTTFGCADDPRGDPYACLLENRRHLIGPAGGEGSGRRRPTSRSGRRSVLAPDQPDSRRTAMTAAYTFDVFCTLDGYGSYAANGNWGGYWGKQGPEFLDRRLAVYRAEQRMVFGANT